MCATPPQPPSPEHTHTDTDNNAVSVGSIGNWLNGGREKRSWLFLNCCPVGVSFSDGGGSEMVRWSLGKLYYIQVEK